MADQDRRNQEDTFYDQKENCVNTALNCCSALIFIPREETREQIEQYFTEPRG